MRNLFLITSCVLSICSSISFCSGQENVDTNAVVLQEDLSIYGVVLPTKITEPVVSMSKGEQQSIQVSIHRTNTKEIIKDWQKQINPLSIKDKLMRRNKVELNGNEYFIHNTVIQEITNDSIHVYSTIVNSYDSTILTAFFEQEDFFLTEKRDPEVYNNAKSFVKRFAIEQYRIVLS